MNFATENIDEYALNWSDLKGLTEDEKAFVALSCYAVTELNVLSRVYLFSSHIPNGNEIIDAAIQAQRFVLLRTWSAKLFEFSECIKQMNGPKSKLDESVENIAKRASSLFEQVKCLKGYSVAKHIRHEASNHYSFPATKKNLGFVEDSADCGLYLHEMEGNSFYPMGEEVVFGGRIIRHGSPSSSFESIHNMLDDWMEWNIQATKWVRDVQFLAVKTLIVDKLSNKSFEKKKIPVDRNIARTISDGGVPIFLRLEQATPA